MSGNIQAGYPIRRIGECLTQETTNTTWDPWVVCCPNTLSPVNYGDNEQCDAHITDSGPVPYNCANSTWALWSHAGYFCCEKDQTGFWVSDEDNWAYMSYGCATDSLVRRNSSLTIADLQSSPSTLLLWLMFLFSRSQLTRSKKRQRQARKRRLQARIKERLLEAWSGVFVVFS